MISIAFSLNSRFIREEQFVNLSRRCNFAISRNLSGKSEYDLIVIGGGPAGYVASIKAAQLGLKTACVEGRGSLGGTCLNVGCIPSKSLLHNTHLFHLAKTEFKNRGICVSNLDFDLQQMLKSKDTSVNNLVKGISGLFKKNNVEWVNAWGRVVSGNKVVAKGNDGSVRELVTKNIIIATGSEPVSFPGVEMDEKTIITSTGALSLEKVPEELFVLGGGVIGLELGTVWQRLGAKVTVVEFLDKIGGSMDSEISKAFQKILTKQGLKILTGTKVTGVARMKNGKVKILMENVANGNKSESIADVLLVSIGRKPYTEGLGLKELNVKLSKNGQIEVDHEFNTNIPSIKAIGDVIRGPMLAHKAEEEGIAAVELIVNGYGEVNYGAIPSVVYTWPEVAWVGKTEEEVKNSGIEYAVGSFPMMANSRARAVDDFLGMVKVIKQKNDDKILGIHIIGPNAGEIIGEATLALEYGASSEDIARTSHAHPTYSEALKEACMAAYDKAIHC